MLFTPGYSKTVFLSLCMLFVDCSMLFGSDLLNQEAKEVIGFYEQRDLELTGSLNQSHTGVFSRLDQTQTIFGQKRLMHHLTHPTNSLEILEKRQSIIRTLQENSDLVGTITVLLEQIKENQHGLEYFLNSSGDTADKHVIENYYFSFNYLKKFNESTAALSTRDTAKKIGLFAPVVEHLMIHAFMHSLTHEEACTDHHHGHEGHDHGHDHHGHGHSCNHWWDFLKPSKEVATILNILHLGVFANSVYEMVGHVQTRTAVLNHLYSKIAAVQACFTSMNELYDIINENPELSNACEQANFFASGENTQLTELMTLFQGNYFGTEDSLGFFSSVGSTLRANTLLKQCLSTWQHALDMIGDIDAYASISRLLNKYKSKAGKFSLVRFIKNSERPQISFKGLWNLMLDVDSVVVNDVSLGLNEQPSFMIITGPNKAGKSSILKALGLGIVFAQSFGVANAADAEMTIFDNLLTYMTVTDDITKDTSLMVAEMGRADACIKSVENLQSNQNACCLIDDSLFKGTTFQKGQDLAYTFVRTLGNFKNNCGMVATHTALLTQLELDVPSLFRNYYIPTIAVDNGKVASTFLLQPGISSPDNVLAIVQSK